MFKLRSAQQRVFAFPGGKMGVSAVPGSGKTFTLSCLAARLIGEGQVGDDQEVLIVTLVNSAVNNFEQRLALFLREEYGMLPRIGYRVRTLHGLAHDIVRERPDLCGLPHDFAVLDESETNDILRKSVQAWLGSHPEFIEDWQNPDVPSRDEYGYNSTWGQIAFNIANAFIRQAKDLEATPEEIRGRLNDIQMPQPLLEMGLEIYASYQESLAYRSGVDFADLIRLALRALRSDPELLRYLRHRWPFILEDEAQDSSRLQEEILRLLVGEQGGWVRVGDPNQAIYETFTTANPRYLRDFLNEPGVSAVPLPNSGRSTRSIIDLANGLLDWCNENHPAEALRDALSVPHILPTDPGDAQPNPADQPDDVYLMPTSYQAEKEIETVVRSAKRWVAAHPDATVAVLVTRNERGNAVAQDLREAGVEVVELLKNAPPTREIAEQFAKILHYLENPKAANQLAALFEIFAVRLKQDVLRPETVNTGLALLKSCPFVEDYLRPLGKSWLRELQDRSVPGHIIDLLVEFSTFVNRWQEAALLPIDQLILTLSADLLSDPPSLALAHKLALTLEHDARANPGWQLANFRQELNRIARNQRKLSGFGEEENGFDPDKHKGKVVVATVHKAKGLEWDRVYLLSANNYDFPSLQPYDRYLSERKIVRDALNLEAETLARLNALIRRDLPGLYMEYGEATLEARRAYCAERLRLLYVAITRAKKELVITWNTGKQGDLRAAEAFVALQGYWERRCNGITV